MRFVLVTMAVAVTFAYPDDWAKLTSSCTAHPTRGYKVHGGPLLDSSATFDVTSTSGHAALCPGQTHSLRVVFPSPDAEFFLTTSQGTFGNPYAAACPNQIATWLTSADNSYSDTVAITCDMTDTVAITCDMTGAVQLLVSWSESKRDSYHQATLTMNVDPSCTAAESGPCTLPTFAANAEKNSCGNVGETLAPGADCNVQCAKFFTAGPTNTFTYVCPATGTTMETEPSLTCTANTCKAAAGTTCEVGGASTIASGTCSTPTCAANFAGTPTLPVCTDQDCTWTFTNPCAGIAGTCALPSTLGINIVAGSSNPCSGGTVLGNGATCDVQCAAGYTPDDGSTAYICSTNGDVLTPPALTCTGTPPTVTSVSPVVQTKNLLGGDTLTITGTLFVMGATVSIGGTACTSVTFVSATSITCTAPAKPAGSYPVVVTNLDAGYSTAENIVEEEEEEEEKGRYSPNWQEEEAEKEEEESDYGDTGESTKSTESDSGGTGETDSGGTGKSTECDCQRGYYGPTCVTANGATMAPRSLANMCDCQRGYYGPTCERPQRSLAKMHHGFWFGISTCDCQQGYYGPTCVTWPAGLLWPPAGLRTHLMVPSYSQNGTQGFLVRKSGTFSTTLGPASGHRQDGPTVVQRVTWGERVWAGAGEGGVPRTVLVRDWGEEDRIRVGINMWGAEDLPDGERACDCSGATLRPYSEKPPPPAVAKRVQVPHFLVSTTGTPNCTFSQCDCQRGYYGPTCEKPPRSLAKMCQGFWFHGNANCTFEVKVDTPCVNGCNERGECQVGWCRCHPGYFGADCSLSLSSAGQPELLAGVWLIEPQKRRLPWV
eukprot:gene24847-10503_t